MSREILYIDGEYCQTLSKLKGYFICGPKPKTRLFYELLALHRNGLLIHWLEQRDYDEEQKLAAALRDVCKTQNDNQLMADLVEVFKGLGSQDFMKQGPSSLKLEGVRCIFSRGREISLSSGDGQLYWGRIDSLNEDNTQSVKCLLYFRIQKESTKKSHIQLISNNGEDIHSVIVSLKDYKHGSLVPIIFPSIKVYSKNVFEKYNIRLNGENIAVIRLDVGSCNHKLNILGEELNMVFVCGGTFIMGASEEQGNDAFRDENPTHEVTLSSFYMGETVVTQRLWRTVMYDNPSKITGKHCPVVDINFDDCLDFIDELNKIMKDQLNGLKFRLPTEAEWEFAARGGICRKHYKYAGSNDIDKVAWYEDNSDVLQKVGLKLPNELGLYDMSGNIWEWCSDIYGSYSNDAVCNPKGASSGVDFVLRGGAWDSKAVSCRVSNRYKYNPSYQPKGMIGLRLVLSES